MILDITSDIIDEAESACKNRCKSRARYCPVAIAITQQTKKEASVTYGCIRVNNKSMATPENIKDILRIFDGVGTSLTPLKISIDIESILS